LGEWKYSSSALVGGEWSASRLGHVPPVPHVVVSTWKFIHEPCHVTCRQII